MTITGTLQQAWSRFFASGAFEQDPGFRDEMLRLWRKGMLAVSALGLLGMLLLVGSFLLADKTFAWHYSDPTRVVLWDKLLILALSLVFLGLARSRLDLSWGRLAATVLLLAGAVGILIDDVARGDTSFSPAYVGLVMLTAVGLIPYRPWQALALGFAMIGAFALSINYLPASFGVEALRFSRSQLVFLFIIALVCAGISTLLYNSRFEQYQARRREEQLKEQVMEQADRLRAMEGVKSRFFVNISHEFRTPLTLILGPLQDALDGAFGPVDERLQQQHRIMQRNATRLLRLINQLLDLSRLEAGRLELHAHRADLVPLLKRLVATFASRAERNGVQLQFHAAPEPVELYFDADKLEKVFINLLSNAFTFTPEGGKIRVAVEQGADKAGGFVEVTVRDTGHGIPAEALPHLFDRFYQVDRSTTRMHEGTGIGLALVKELVVLHGGEVRAESEAGFGSTFFVRLPLGSDHLDPAVLAEETPEAASAPPALVESGPLEASPQDDPEETPPQDAPLVLVVEDNADMRAYLKAHLAGSYQIEEAEDGAQGLARARATQPALVISDVMMPQMDGYALCRALKTDEKLNHIPVILLTAKADEASKLEGLETGADDYLYKPFNAQELLARVENLIEIRRRLRQRFSGEVILGPSQIAVPSAEAVFLERVRDVAEAHLGDGNFGVDWLADEVGLSVRQLRRRLKAATRLSPGGYLRMMRLQRAAQLLEQQAGSVAEVAYQVGFQDPDYFSRLFKQTFGVSPSEYGTEGT